MLISTSPSVCECEFSVSVHLQQVLHQPKQVSCTQLLWKAVAHRRHWLGRERVCQNIWDSWTRHAYAEQAEQRRQIQTR